MHLRAANCRAKILRLNLETLTWIMLLLGWHFLGARPLGWSWNWLRSLLILFLHFIDYLLRILELLEQSSEHVHD